jgi:hypothetical protein
MIAPEYVVLWLCPVCGKTESNTGQTARYCGETRACTTRQGGRVDLTRMERWVYAPVEPADSVAFNEIQRSEEA